MSSPPAQKILPLLAEPFRDANYRQLLIVSIAIWPFTTMPEKYVLTIPLLIAIHILAGMSTAGVNHCASNIALKASPRGKATAFLATSSLVNGMCATLAPILAGLSADRFARRELSFAAKWSNLAEQASHLELPVISLRGLDFLFGLYALHRLIAVREEGEIEEKSVLKKLLQQTRKAVRHVSNVAGLRNLTYFPYYRLKNAAQQPKNDVSTDGGEKEKQNI